MKSYYGIGLMSGTSLDGLDLCYARFWEDESWFFEILKAETFPYSPSWKERLSSAVNLPTPDLLQLNAEYGFYLGDQVEVFKARHQVQKLDFIASHGHTVFHQPERKFTCQIGDGRAIKIVTHTPTVYDFRSEDVLLGGNGAPLVPIGDRLLFSKYAACLNLGGFSNISFEKDGKRLAFDICPVNFVLNRLAVKLGCAFDKDGEIAKANRVDPVTLEALNRLSYYQKDGAKSLGSEWVATEIDPLIDRLKPEVGMATFLQHIAVQISNSLSQHQLKEVLVTGGGTHNTYLIRTLQKLTSAKLFMPDPDIINFKEALIFAFLGLLRILNRNNVLASATGASTDHSAGLLV